MDTFNSKQWIVVIIIAIIAAWALARTYGNPPFPQPMPVPPGMMPPPNGMNVQGGMQVPPPGGMKVPPAPSSR